MEIGTRVAVVRAFERERVTIYGFGWYVGQEQPPDFARYLGAASRRPTAVIELDDGNIVYGIEGLVLSANRAFDKLVGPRKLERVAVDEKEARSRKAAVRRDQAIRNMKMPF